MRPAFRLAPAFLLLALCACAAREEATTTYTFEPVETPGGALCVGECGDARNYCEEACDYANRACTRDVQVQALQDYEAYARAQFEAHEPIELRASDFERMKPCDDAKKSCLANCSDHYRMCYQNCGGKVTATTSCQSYCF